MSGNISNYKEVYKNINYMSRIISDYGIRNGFEEIY